MKANIINIGNSKGVIIPAKLLKLIGLDKHANIDVIDNKIVIEPVKKQPREGWEEMIMEDIKLFGEPEILIPEVFEDETFEDLTW